MDKAICEDEWKACFGVCMLDVKTDIQIQSSNLELQIRLSSISCI
jgi:hypothetical protein